MRNGRHTRAWIAIVALVATVAQGALHDLHDLAASAGRADLAFGDDDRACHVLGAPGQAAALATAEPVPDGSSHDGAACPVCRALAHARATLAPSPINAAAPPGEAHALAASAIVVASGAARGPSAPRAPPLLA
jgi:hypothetical protein